MISLAILTVSAAAGPFSQLVIFGDSLSDVGNLEAAINLYPGPYYYDGRFSNGPVYAEALSAGLGLGTSVRSTAGGDNFAYGGAKTAGTGGLEGIFIRDIDEQVTQYLNTRSADPSALYLVFAGSNDLVGGQTNVDVPVNNLAADMSRLIDAGAQNFFVFNLPWLGYTPRYNGSPTTFDIYNTRSQQFNTSLSTMLDGLESGNPALSVFGFDVAALFNEAIADPQAFGLTNVTDAAAPGLQPGASSYDTNQIAPNANEYLFWDDLHPTAAVHAILSQRALVVLATPGDFNGDDAVDAADYVALRKELGGPYTPDRYAVWRENFSATGGGSGGSAVPEPAVWMLLVSVAAILHTLGVRARYNEG